MLGVDRVDLDQQILPRSEEAASTARCIACLNSEIYRLAARHRAELERAGSEAASCMGDNHERGDVLAANATPRGVIRLAGQRQSRSGPTPGLRSTSEFFFNSGCATRRCECAGTIRGGDPDRAGIRDRAVVTCSAAVSISLQHQVRIERTRRSPANSAWPSSTRHDKWHGRVCRARSEVDLRSATRD